MEQFNRITHLEVTPNISCIRNWTKYVLICNRRAIIKLNYIYVKQNVTTNYIEQHVITHNMFIQKKYIHHFDLTYPFKTSLSVLTTMRNCSWCKLFFMPWAFPLTISILIHRYRYLKKDAFALEMWKKSSKKVLANIYLVITHVLLLPL